MTIGWNLNMLLGGMLDVNEYVNIEGSALGESLESVGGLDIVSSNEMLDGK